MNDMKSKLPDLKEVGAMAKKLFGDVKTSVEEIIKDYKANREQSENTPKEEVKPKAASPKKETIKDEPPKV